MSISPLAAVTYQSATAEAAQTTQNVPEKAAHSTADASSAVLSAEQVKQALNDVNKVVQTMTSDVRFTVDEETGIRVVKVMDSKTNEVIRQFPAKEVVELAKSLDKLRGLIIRQTA